MPTPDYRTVGAGPEAVAVSPTAVPTATVTVPAEPTPVSTVTVTVPPAPTIPQWNPQIPQVPDVATVYQVKHPTQTTDGGISVGSILGWTATIAVVVFVIVAVVVSIIVVAGRDRDDTKRTAKVFATVAIAALMIVAVTSTALFTLSNGIVQSIVSGVGG